MLRALRPCSVPGCPNIAVQGGRCQVHARDSRRRYEVMRASASERGYGSRWRKIRAQFLKVHKWCAWPGCSKLAVDVDHILPRAKGGTDDWDNLQALCHEHHSRKTATQDGGGWQKR